MSVVIKDQTELNVCHRQSYLIWHMTWPKICTSLAELKKKTSLLESIFISVHEEASAAMFVKRRSHKSDEKSCLLKRQTFRSQHE